MLSRLLDFLFIKVPIKFFKKNILENCNNLPESAPKALLYFKTDAFFSSRLVRSFQHTNNHEILVMIEILSRYGFSVDLIDRDASWEEILRLKNKDYSLYIGNAAGLGAPFHSRVLDEFSIKTKVMFAAGPEPRESNRLVKERHLEFEQRTGSEIKHRRMIPDEDFDQRFKSITAVFSIGNDFSMSTFARHKIPTHRIYPSSAPSLSADATSFHGSPRRFLYFGGNGLVCKGLDLVLEAFDGLRDILLDICGPSTEQDFWQHYEPVLRRNPNIRFHGFVAVGDLLFNRLSSECAFNLFPGSAEGSATSVAACMRRGIIPVVTKQTGIDIGEFGVEIKDHSVAAIRELILRLSKMPQEDVLRRSINTYLASYAYTEHGFRLSFEKALLSTLFQSGVNPTP